MSDGDFSSEFIGGFVKRCMELGLSADQTENLFHQQANNALLSRPQVQSGLQSGLKKISSLLPPKLLLSTMDPATMTTVVDCRVHYGSDPMSIGLRKIAGLPEPSWDTVSAEVVKIAHALMDTAQGFSHLPINQQILIASLAGAGLGAGKRALSPTNEDEAQGRGVISRSLRGAGRGAVTGAGVGAGAVGGGELAKRLGKSGLNLPLMLGGGLAGGMAGNQLAKAV